MTGAAI